eukprot:140449-Chlamydomonas_euryale.AAC.14
MVQAVTAAAAARLLRERQRHGLKHQFNVPLGNNRWRQSCRLATARRMEAQRVAHKTWMRSRSAAAKKARNRVPHKADAAVQLDQQRWLGAQIGEGQARLRVGNMRVWAWTVKRVAGENTTDRQDGGGLKHKGQSRWWWTKTQRTVKVVAG